MELAYNRYDEFASGKVLVLMRRWTGEFCGGKFSTCRMIEAMLAGWNLADTKRFSKTGGERFLQ